MSPFRAPKKAQKFAFIESGLVKRIQDQQCAQTIARLENPYNRFSAENFRFNVLTLLGFKKLNHKTFINFSILGGGGNNSENTPPPTTSRGREESKDVAVL